MDTDHTAGNLSGSLPCILPYGTQKRVQSLLGDPSTPGGCCGFLVGGGFSRASLARSLPLQAGCASHVSIGRERVCASGGMEAVYQYKLAKAASTPGRTGY